MFKWESKFEKNLKKLLEKTNEEQIKSLERQADKWQAFASESNKKYIDLLIKQHKDSQRVKVENVSTEDLVDTKGEFGFDVALRLLKEGKKVKRKHWGGYWVLEEWDKVGYEKSTPLIVAYLKDGGYAPATPYQGDLLSSDWMIVK